MKKDITGFLAIVLACGFVLSNPLSVSASGFEKKGKDTVYVQDDGTYAKGWKTIDGDKYYFSKKGVMHTGWLKTSSGNNYYFSKTGKMVTTKITVEGIVYTFDENGVCNDAYLSAEKAKELKSERRNAVAAATKLEKEIESLSTDLIVYKTYAEYYQDLYSSYYSLYNDAVIDAKNSAKTRMVYSGNGSWSTKTDDWTQDTYVRKYDSLTKSAEREWNTYKKKYDNTNSQIKKKTKEYEKYVNYINQIDTLLEYER